MPYVSIAHLFIIAKVSSNVQACCSDGKHTGNDGERKKCFKRYRLHVFHQFSEIEMSNIAVSNYHILSIYVRKEMGVVVNRVLIYKKTKGGVNKNTTRFVLGGKVSYPF